MSLPPLSDPNCKEGPEGYIKTYYTLMDEPKWILISPEALPSPSQIFDTVARRPHPFPLWSSRFFFSLSVLLQRIICTEGLALLFAVRIVHKEADSV